MVILNIAIVSKPITEHHLLLFVYKVLAMIIRDITTGMGLLCSSFYLLSRFYRISSLLLLIASFHASRLCLLVVITMMAELAAISSSFTHVGFMDLEWQRVTFLMQRFPRS